MNKIAKILCSLIFALSLCFPAMSAKEIGVPKGFDGKVYQASYALYATSEAAGVDTPKFLCTVTAYDKVSDGYVFLGAGHCTSANPDLPSDLKFFVESDLRSAPQSVQLLIAVLNDPIDYSLFYLKTKDKIETVAIGDESDLIIGDKVIDVNFSLALTKEVSHGIVSSKVATSGEMKGFYGVDMFDSHGASGSSVVDEKSKKIVGIVIAGIDGATLPTWIEPISAIESELKKLDVAALIVNPESPKVAGPQEYHTPWRP